MIPTHELTQLETVLGNYSIDRRLNAIRVIALQRVSAYEKPLAETLFEDKSNKLLATFTELVHAPNANVATLINKFREECNALATQCVCACD